jgi:hypothetical protein
MRVNFSTAGFGLFLLLYACANEALPIGTNVGFSKFAPCAPSSAGLDQLLQAEKSGEGAFYKALDALQAITVKAGDQATVITALRDKVRVRLPQGNVNRLRDNTCWVARDVIAK